MTHYGQNEVNHQRNISFLVGHTTITATFPSHSEDAVHSWSKTCSNHGTWWSIRWGYAVVILEEATKHAERKQINKSHWPIKVSRARFIGREQLAKHHVLVFWTFDPLTTFWFQIVFDFAVPNYLIIYSRLGYQSNSLWTKSQLNTE